MKRSPRTINATLAVAAMAAGMAASVPAFGGAYVTIDLVARPAQINNNRYANASNGSGLPSGSGGVTPLPGYQASAPGNTLTDNNTLFFDGVGFTSIVTPTSVGQVYELGIRVTLAPEGTTNAFATGATSIANWNPSFAANPTGLTALAFNIVGQVAPGIQADFLQQNQGKGYNPKPAGINNNSIAAIQAKQVVLSQGTASSIPLGVGGSTYGGFGFDAGTGYSGGTLVARAGGFKDASHVVLVNTAGAPTLIGGSGTTGVPITNSDDNYIALSYFNIGALGATSTLNFDFAGFAGTELLAGLRWRNAADSGEVSFTPTLAQQLASVAGLDPIIKVNVLTLVGTAAAVTPAAVTANPVSGSGRTTGQTITLTNTAVGATVDPAVISALNITNALAANATWGQAGFTNGQLLQGNGGASAVSTVTVTPAANLLGNIKGNGTLTFNVNGQTTPATTGEGGYSYNLNYTNTTNSTPIGAGTNFGTASTGAVATGDKIVDVFSTENGGSGRTLTIKDSSVLGGTATVNVAWRLRSSLEAYPGSVPPLPPGISSLITDVANVTLSGNLPATYVVQMDYNEAGLGGIDEITSFNAQHLFLAHMTPQAFGSDTGNGGAEDSWKNATLDSGSPQNGVLAPYQASFLNTPGLWGADTVNNVVWAVLPSSVQGQFAVVPEPASIGLLALGALGLIRRRRR